MIAKITINDAEYEIVEGESILDACSNLGIFVPHLCYLSGLSPSGICGLCVVEINDSSVALSCLTPIKDGMSIKTDSEKLSEIRRLNIGKILSRHKINCFNCPKNGVCNLQKFAAKIYGYEEVNQSISLTSHDIATQVESLKISDDLFYDAQNCINCTRCVKFLNKVCGHSIKNIHTVEISQGDNTSLNVLDVCPTFGLNDGKNETPEFLCESLESYDITDVFTPKLSVALHNNEIIRVSSNDYISNKSRVELRHIPKRNHDDKKYEDVINNLSSLILSGNREKSIFVIGDNIDITSLYYLKNLATRLPNIAICINDCGISSNDINIGYNNENLSPIDFAVIIGNENSIELNHLKKLLSRAKNVISIPFNDLEITSADYSATYNNPSLFIFADVFQKFGRGAVTSSVEKFRSDYAIIHGKDINVSIIPSNLSQMLLGEIDNKLSLETLFSEFNRHDMKFLCVVGDVEFEMKSTGIYTVYNTVLQHAAADDVEYIPTKHFTEDSTYYINALGKLVKTTELIKSNLKSNREFLFDLMKKVFGEKFYDINNEIHRSIRTRFFQ